MQESQEMGVWSLGQEDPLEEEISSPASPELAGGFFIAEPPDKLQAIEYTHNFDRFFWRGGKEGFITCSK